MTRPSVPSPPDADIAPGRHPTLRIDAPGDAADWVREHGDELRTFVGEHGALLIRGLDLANAELAAAALRALGGLTAEMETFAARRPYGGDVYSSTPWPPNLVMCQHHELSYVREPPRFLLFACIEAPSSGGATPLADAAAVLQTLPAQLVAPFEREGWLLKRNYGEEIGASLADAFGSDDRRSVEDYCRSHAIEFEWRAGGSLRTRQRRSAVLRHPSTGRRCWFNQAAFLSRWTMAAELREYMVDVYGEDGLPFDTSLGNGDPIDAAVVEAIQDAYEANVVREPWRAGDLLLVDNLGTSHGRDPFEGHREVLVAMADPVPAGG